MEYIFYDQALNESFENKSSSVKYDAVLTIMGTIKVSSSSREALPGIRS